MNLSTQAGLTPEEEIRALRREAAQLLAAGEPREALRCLEQALERAPEVPITYAELGRALQALQRFPEALTSYERALALKPDFFAALINRSNALRSLARFEEALADLETALRLQPASPEALNNHGTVLRDLKRLDEALVSFDGALMARPGFALALCNRGNTLLDLKRPRAALADFETALQLASADPEAHFGRALTLLALKERLEEAIAEFDRAGELGIDQVECLVGKASALAELEQHREAAAHLTSLLQLAPDRPYAHGSRLHSLRQAAEWANLAQLTQELTQRVQEGRRVSHPQSLLPLVDVPELHQICSRTFAADEYPEVPVLGPCTARTRAARQKIRVAYLSADFREHPVSYLLVGALEQHDRQQFEVIGVSQAAARGGAFEQRVWRAFDRFIDVTQLADKDAAQMLRELEVDIAVDLMGYTQGLRLGILAHRAAPVQVSYLGYASTLATPYIDYLLADAVVIPPEEEGWYSEKVVRLPHCYLPHDDRREMSPAPGRAQAGLPEDALVLCAFTNVYKISPAMFEIWMQLLREVPGSVLWLSDTTPEARTNLQRHAQVQGVPAQRLVFAPHLPSVAEHLGRQSLADLYLDTFPYNAHSTALEALWSGVPVLTCAGRSLAARTAASALTAAGLPELITHSLEEYCLKGMSLARQRDQLDALKVMLAANRSSAPLFDTARFTRHLEMAYRQMHEHAVRGAPPASFTVQALASSGTGAVA